MVAITAMPDAIILAGGLGTRLRSVVPDRPKPMASVAGRPFLEILLTSLATKGFRRVILSLGYKADEIIAHFGADFQGVELIYVVEKNALGTGGAVRLAMESSESDHVFVFNGDTFLDLEVAAVERQWQCNRLPIIVGAEVANGARYGRLMVNGDKVSGFLEKGGDGPGLINAGCYVLNKGQLAAFPPGVVFSLESDYLNIAISDSCVEVFITAEGFIDIGVPEDYAKAQILLKDIADRETSR